MIDNSTHKIQLFKSLFRGREDVFAIRWEKGNKSGYMPACEFDPYLFRKHKMRGGTFSNYPDKIYKRLTDHEIIKHLKGEQQIGVYPMLSDNTSWFLVADFDKVNWIEDCRRFISICSQNSIPAYMERSRSGNGGHVWIFFDRPYPAIKSRRIFISLLEQSGAFSLIDKGASFDRLFPNQDFLSGKGFGNLIALPLFRKTLEQQNSCFINTETLEPVSDQWQFLNDIKRINTKTLSHLDNGLGESKPYVPRWRGLGVEFFKSHTSNGSLYIKLSNIVALHRDGLVIELINFLKEELNFTNSEFIIKKKSGRSTFGIVRHFKLFEESENDVIIPKGFVGKIIRFCRNNNIEYELVDERNKLPPVSFVFNVRLRNYQQDAIDSISKKEMGVIVAPPGTGKTILALKMIADKQQPALIIVHRKQLLKQWNERIEAFLGIPGLEIGKIIQGKTKIGKKVTLATIQSLAKALDKPLNAELKSSFGIVVIDECHHIPAESYRTTIQQINSYFLYGLTATPFRKYNDGKMIFIHLGEIIATINLSEVGSAKQAFIIIRNTQLCVPFNSKTDRFETLSNILIHDSARNKLIIDDLYKELNDRNRVVVITERKEHISTLYQYLKQSFETITLSGDDSESNRALKWKLLKNGNYQVLITTGQYFGEGTDLPNVHCLFLVYPFSFHGKLVQYIGRVQRSEVTPTIYDYRDLEIDYLNKLFLKRNAWYRKIKKQATLFDEPAEDIVDSGNTFAFSKKLRLDIDKLEFRYGGVVFNYTIPSLNTELEFEIENHDIRPEFEVLKPFFAKVLKSKSIRADIEAEFENGELVSQLATSSDIERINRNVIDSVKFNFITRNFLKLSPESHKKNLLTINEIQKSDMPLYTDGKELLDNILQRQSYKHTLQLRYLAEKHQSTILKIRYVLSPFSFVFLITGRHNHHIILETLDTEEATYIWHTDKSKNALRSGINEIEQHLSIIRIEGRLFFLELQPNNFSRIYHDYTNDKKGFIIWKDALEELLY